MKNTCPRCALKDFGTTKRADGIRHRATTKMPSIRTLERQSFNGVAKATDGCKVEPDGRCPHGHSSWLILAGVI